MKCILSLSGDHLDLGKEEALSLFDVKKHMLSGSLLVIDLKDGEKYMNNPGKRLALTKRIYKFLFECNVDKLVGSMKNFDWNSVYSGSFFLRTCYFGGNNNENSITKKSTGKKRNKRVLNKIRKYSEKNLAGYIWRSVKKPKVSLENPKTKIDMFIIGDSVYCGLLIFEN